jgi:hypothetical protein
LTTIKQRLCLICKQGDENVPAVAEIETLVTYYDVCKNHLDTIKKAIQDGQKGLSFRMLKEKEIVEESDSWQARHGED